MLQINSATQQPFRLVEYYRTYCFEIHPQGDGYCGKVHLPNSPAVEIAGLGVDEVIQKLRDQVDAFIIQRCNQTTPQVPDAHHYQLATHQVWVQLSRDEKSLLSFHAKQPSFHADIEALLDALDVRSTTQLLITYARIARSFSDALCFQPHSRAGYIDPIVQVLLEPIGPITLHDPSRWLVMNPKAGNAINILREDGY